MTLDAQVAIRDIWLILGLVWLVGLAFTKRTVRAQTLGTRVLYLALILLGFSLLGFGRLSVGWLGLRWLPPGQGWEITGLAFTAAGCLFAIWARITLGGNWSGRATVKAGHELIVSGPYAVARHPIYTGLLLASVGTAMAFGEARCLLGLAVLLLAFAVKISQEERLMLETFPEAYPVYRRRVKALIPGVF